MFEKRSHLANLMPSSTSTSKTISRMPKNSPRRLRKNAPRRQPTKRNGVLTNTETPTTPHTFRPSPPLPLHPQPIPVPSVETHPPGPAADKLVAEGRQTDYKALPLPISPEP